MSPDSLTPIGPSQFDAITGPRIGPVSAAVIGPDRIAVLEGGTDFGSFFIDGVAVFDSEGRALSFGGGPNAALYVQAPPDTFSVSAAVAGQYGVGALVVVNWADSGFANGNIPAVDDSYYATAPLNGAASAFRPLGIPGETSGAVAFAGPTGFHLEWLTGNEASGFTRWQEDFTASGSPLPGALTQTEGAALIPYAGLILNGSAFTIEDNVAQFAGAAPVTLPGEPAHAITRVAAAALADGTHAVVGWVDSGTDYVSLFDSQTDSFGPVIGLDWGGASDLHLAALPDGGFAVSWMKDGAYRGEMFSADGTGGGEMSLAGEVSGVTATGVLYTISNTFHVQQYQIDPAQVVSTSDPTYAAPDGVRTVVLTGSGQTVTANGQGDVIWSNDSGAALIGGSGNDTFYIGRGGDWVAGNGGEDIFKFSAVPWAGAHIYGFTTGDTLDLTVMQSTLFPVSAGDPFAAGYLKLTDDGAGDAQLWADYHLPDNSGWWLVATIDAVSSSSLHYSGGLIT